MGEYEYAANMRQKGNTVFETNPAFDRNQSPVWGLCLSVPPYGVDPVGRIDPFQPLLLAAVG